MWGALVWRGGLLPDRAAGQSVLIVDGVTDTGTGTKEIPWLPIDIYLHCSYDSVEHSEGNFKCKVR